MEQQLTQKQEAFCQAVITSANNSDAYRAAYDAGKMKPATIHRRAKEMVVSGKIAARIAVLRAAYTERHLVTVESLTADMQRILGNAEEDRQHSASVSAVNLIAKMHGMLVDRVKVEPVTIEIKRSYD